MYLELFWTFLKIGFTSFGGLSMVPLINSEMVRHAWMTQTEVADIVAIAEMTPGPMGLNCATFAGTRVAGTWGALAATLGVLMPAFTTCLLAVMFFEKFKSSRRMQNALYGIRPVCIGLIAGVGISLIQSNVFSGGVFVWQAAVIAVVGGLLVWKWNLSVPKLIGISALLGILLVR
ncbi:MAG: chromate transporter [Clostridiaceae bacterium]|nr:chromate transporter [Clostridiaceae bacterium]